MDRRVPSLVPVGRVEVSYWLADIEKLLQPGLTLILGILIRFIQPERRPGHVGDDVGQRDFRYQCLSGLHRSDDRHHAHPWVRDRLEHRFDLR